MIGRQVCVSFVLRADTRVIPLLKIFNFCIFALSGSGTSLAHEAEK